MLWECTETKHNLQQIKAILLSKKMSIQFNEELIIFNIGKHYNEAELFLILLIKHYIFSSKTLNIPKSINALKKKLAWGYEVHKYIAIKITH